jgi:hypothetical protein
VLAFGLAFLPLAGRMILLRAARYGGQVRLRLAYGGTGDTGTSLLLRQDYGGQGGETPPVGFSSQNTKSVFLHSRSKLKGLSLRVMEIKEKKSAKEQVPFDPIRFAATVPSRQPTMKDRTDAKERPDDPLSRKITPRWTLR